MIAQYIVIVNAFHMWYCIFPVVVLKGDRHIYSWLVIGLLHMRLATRLGEVWITKGEIGAHKKGMPSDYDRRAFLSTVSVVTRLPVLSSG